jgi:hypothetical protein
LVIARAHVELCEVLCASQLIKDLIYDRHRKSVLHCDLIQSTVIDAKPPTTVLLLH